MVQFLCRTLTNGAGAANVLLSSLVFLAQALGLSYLQLSDSHFHLELLPSRQMQLVKTKA